MGQKINPWKIVGGVAMIFSGAVLLAIGFGLFPAASVQDRTGSVIGGVSLLLIGIAFVAGQFVGRNAKE